MLKLAEQNDVDIDPLVNNTDKTGKSFFYLATVHSEKISLELINRNVKVNRIDNKFNTPDFRVR